MQQTVYILLASFNGEKFIAQQIDSIIRQTYKNWKLFIRDDGSTDATVSVIKQYANRFPKQVFFVEDELGNLGSTGNFNALLQYAQDAEYIMFCDQDDVWFPEKVEITLNEMERFKKVNKLNIPLLVYTNFIYADENLNPISSKENFTATKVKHLSFANMLAQNPVYGCTMMINNQLLQKAKNIPSAAENHDFWIALVASAVGEISYLNKQTLLYRQHAKNISGHHTNDSINKRITRNLIEKNIYKDVRNKFKMAQAFKERFYTELTNDQKNVLDNFLALGNKKNPFAIIKNLRSGVRRQTILQTFLFYTAILFKKQSGDFN